MVVFTLFLDTKKDLDKQQIINLKLILVEEIQMVILKNMNVFMIQILKQFQMIYLILLKQIFLIKPQNEKNMLKKLMIN